MNLLPLKMMRPHSPDRNARVFFSLIFILITSSCTSLFYQPNRYLYANPGQKNIEFSNVYFPSQDGTELHAWHLKNTDNLKTPKGLIIFFHGNAQNLSAHFVSLAWLAKEGYDIFAFDYRGYGISKGKAEPEGIYEDSIAALNKAWEIKEKGQHEKFIVYSQSLGGAIAMRAHKDFKHKDKIDLLVLDSTFSSYKRQAFAVATKTWVTWIFSPLAWLIISDKYSPEDYIPQIKTPTLVVHGTDDQVVPFKFGKEIFEDLMAPKKWFWERPGGQHITTFSNPKEPYRENFLKLLEEL